LWDKFEIPYFGLPYFSDNNFAKSLRLSSCSIVKLLILFLKDCGASTDNGCFHSANELKRLDGTEDSNNYNTASYYNFITSDGILFNYQTYPAYTYPFHPGRFAVDINGKKGSNLQGRDLFIFDIFLSNVGIKPYCAFMSGTGTAGSSTGINANCHSSDNSASGVCCAAKVLAEGAMNY